MQLCGCHRVRRQLAPRSVVVRGAGVGASSAKTSSRSTIPRQAAQRLAALGADAVRSRRSGVPAPAVDAGRRAASGSSACAAKPAGAAPGPSARRGSGPRATPSSCAAPVWNQVLVQHGRLVQRSGRPACPCRRRPSARTPRRRSPRPCRSRGTRARGGRSGRGGSGSCARAACPAIAVARLHLADAVHGERQPRRPRPALGAVLAGSATSSSCTRTRPPCRARWSYAAQQVRLARRPSGST